MLASRLYRRLCALLMLVLLLAMALPAAGNAGEADRPAKLHPHLARKITDAPNDTIDVIVQLRPGVKDRSAAAKAVGARLKKDLSFIGSVHLSMTAKNLGELQKRSDVVWVSPDIPLRSTATVDTASLKTIYNQAIGSPYAWNTVGATGAGISVAVLDSGLTPPAAPWAGYGSLNLGIGDALDQFGHGTHVAGIINGKAPGYTGVAPGARVLGIKISDSNGAGTTSALLQWLQWIYENRTAYGIRVVNLSVQATIPESYKTSPVDAAVEKLWFAGVVVVAASGNLGANPLAADLAPGNDPFIISVGALDNGGTVDPADDTLATFSGRGTSMDGHFRPDVLAPGRQIISTLAPGSAWNSMFADRIVEPGFIRMSGTSFAAPAVSGAVALLLEKFPALTPDQVKWLLTASASSYATQADTAGVLNVQAMLDLAAAGAPGSANQGLPTNNFLAAHPSDDPFWDQVFWDQVFWDQFTWD